MSEKKVLVFKCPNCGGNELLEVACSDRILSKVEMVEYDNGNIDPHYLSTAEVDHEHGSEIRHYECAACGEILKPSGEEWTSPLDAVLEWFRQQQTPAPATV